MEVDNELIKQIKITPILDSLKLEDIDDNIYFSEKFKNYISNSRLGILKKDGVKVFFEGIPQVYNPSFETGKYFFFEFINKLIFLCCKIN